MRGKTNRNIAMVPVRMGSKRIKSKNIRLINNKPLVFFILKSIINSGVFDLDDIYLNSEDIIFKSIAKQLGINFYLRDASLSSDNATNDQFLYDFLNKLECNNIFQFLATSPLVSPSTIQNFVRTHLSSTGKTTISVKEIRIECLFDNKPINFSSTKQTPPSQELIPIYAYACGLMGWQRDNYIQNYHKFNGAAYHGGELKPNLFCLNQIESIDIDNEKDFIIAEAIINNDYKDKNLILKDGFNKVYWDPSESLVD